MRPHGRARVSPSHPEAHAVCDSCGFLFNHIDLAFQWNWQGPRLQNLRFLRCRSCLDKPSEFKRTLILPPDPVPIANPRPEFNVKNDNPLDGQNFDPLRLVPNSSGITVNGNIGNMTGGAGIDAAFLNQGIITTSSIAALVQGYVSKTSYNSALKGGIL